jgi:hypothetical protein
MVEVNWIYKIINKYGQLADVLLFKILIMLNKSNSMEVNFNFNYVK